MSDRSLPSAGAGILAILMMITGGLIALFAGGCTAIFFGALVSEAFSRGFQVESLGGLVAMTPIFLLGIAITWAGVKVVVAGVEKWKGSQDVQR